MLRAHDATNVDAMQVPTSSDDFHTSKQYFIWEWEIEDWQLQNSHKIWKKPNANWMLKQRKNKEYAIHYKLQLKWCMRCIAVFEWNWHFLRTNKKC